MTTKSTGRTGVITLEIELAKPLSHHTGISLEVAWNDMLDLPLNTDDIQIDRASFTVTRGPADDEILLDAPNSLQDFTWKCRYENDEWMSAEELIRMVRKDSRVLNAKTLR